MDLAGSDKYQSQLGAKPFFTFSFDLDDSLRCRSSLLAKTPAEEYRMLL